MMKMIEKEFEEIAKYKDLPVEIRRLWREEIMAEQN